MNVLRTANAENPRVKLCRQYIDLDETCPSSRPSQTHDLSSEECLARPYIKACGLTSNVVCFMEDSIEKLSENYLSWIESCVETVDEPARPMACIMLCSPHASENLADAFEKQCTTTSARTRVYNLASHTFSRTSIMHFTKLSNQLNRSCINWSLLEEVEQHARQTNEDNLYSLGYYWKEHAVHRLMSLSMAHFTKNGDKQKFSIAIAVSVDVSKAQPSLLHRQAFFDLSAFSDTSLGKPESPVSLVGMYMAYHLLAHCPLLEIENLSSVPHRSHLFLTFCFTGDMKLLLVES